MDKGGTAMKRWKKMMAFCLTFIMAFAMTGISASAANGPNEQEMSMAFLVIDDGSANPKQLYNANKSVTISTVKNISYDKKTNTLTLNGYQEAEKKIVANVMSEPVKMPARHFLRRDYLHIVLYMKFLLFVSLLH